MLGLCPLFQVHGSVTYVFTQRQGYKHTTQTWFCVCISLLPQLRICTVFRLLFLNNSPCTTSQKFPCLVHCYHSVWTTQSWKTGDNLILLIWQSCCNLCEAVTALYWSSGSSYFIALMNLMYQTPVELPVQPVSVKQWLHKTLKQIRVVASKSADHPMPM